MRSFSLDDIPTPELDYNLLISRLGGYRHPRNKINALLKSGTLVRVKKGLYIKERPACCLPLLANMIYGPSYVSSDYALAFYSLIPERVHLITSMATGRRKRFRTPVGEFSYEPLLPEKFALGVRRQEVDERRGFLIATPEKALVDRIWRTRGVSTAGQLEEYLADDLRVDLDARGVYSLRRLEAIRKAYGLRIIDLLAQVLGARGRA